VEQEFVLTKQQAQQVMLASLGLHTSPRYKAGKGDLLTAIRQIQQSAN